jgi:hypothetical protein
MLPSWVNPEGVPGAILSEFAQTTITLIRLYSVAVLAETIPY